MTNTNPDPRRPHELGPADIKVTDEYRRFLILRGPRSFRRIVWKDPSTVVHREGARGLLSITTARDAYVYYEREPDGSLFVRSWAETRDGSPVFERDRKRQAAWREAVIRETENQEPL